MSIFLPILVSLFLPWASYNNFLAFLISQADFKNIGFLISTIIGLFLLIYILSLNIFAISAKKLSKPYGKNGRTHDTGFFWWNFIWISLLTSNIFGLLMIQDGIIVNEGFLLYSYTAHFTIMGIILAGMLLVCYYEGKRPQELRDLPPAKRSLPDQITQFSANFSERITKEDILLYFQTLGYSEIEIEKAIITLVDKKLINF